MTSNAVGSLPAFQQAAADLIVGRLSSPSGPRRFLLADEVGLGKTHVTAEVIRRLRKRRGLSVIYVCSNIEIARQNVRKLGRDAQELPIERLTLLASRTREIAAGRRKKQLQIFPLTPGTSFEVGRGAGLAEERRLLLYLVHRLYGIAPSRGREALRGNAGKRSDPPNDTWRVRTSMRSLQRDFRGVIGKELVRRLRREWNRALIERLLGAQEGRLRNRAIGELRLGLARSVVDALKPDLVVLDEFQRYRSLLAADSGPQDRSVKEMLFGTNLEGRGVVPNIEEPISPEALWNGEDNQLDRAVAHLNQLASVA